MGRTRDELAATVERDGYYALAIRSRGERLALVNATRDPLWFAMEEGDEPAYVVECEGDVTHCGNAQQARDAVAQFIRLGRQELVA